jgi:uncharacterized protein (DUF983 family)
MTEPRINPFIAGLFCRCPRCGQGRLFSGFLKLAPSCSVCGLDYAFADSGDGPAVFVIFVVSPLVVLFALILGALVNLPPFVHLLIWIPVTILMCLALLRPFKATLVALQFRNRAEEGRQ